MQAQEYLTALHNACQCLQSTASGKTAENRLQKALAKVHKLSQPSSKARCQGQTTTTAVHSPLTGANAAKQTAQAKQGTNQNTLEAPVRPHGEANDEGCAQPAGSSQAAPIEQQVTAQSQVPGQHMQEAKTDADKENAAANTAKSMASKEAAKVARDKDRVQKEALKQQQHAEREQQRLAKEQQKAEKEQQRLEKESQKAEREEQKAAKEAEKELLRSGLAACWSLVLYCAMHSKTCSHCMPLSYVRSNAAPFFSQRHCNLCFPVHDLVQSHLQAQHSLLCESYMFSCMYA